MGDLLPSAYTRRRQEEPVSKDLEAEIQRYYSNVGYPKYVQTARHFARWKEQQDKKDISDMLFVEYLRGADEGKKIMVDKAIDWLQDNIYDYLYINRDFNEADYKAEAFFADFRKAT